LVNPYTDQHLDDGAFIRTFDENLNEQELIWHRDKNNREIAVLAGGGWQLQMDNKLPQELKAGNLYYINKEEYHRLIKGNGTLKLKIWEK
jgi:quercetin dioxygenase-like cupin family protein